MIGSELAPFATYILDRAQEELEVNAHRGPLAILAARYYVATFGVPEIGAHVRIRAALSAIPRKARNILDIGCGPGMLIGSVSRLSWRPSVTGIEMDSRAAQIAAAAHPNVVVKLGDFIEAAFPEGTFDCATMVDVLEHVPDDALLSFLTASRRVLKQGGSLIMHVPATNQRRHFRRFQSWEHHDHAREGFTEPQLRELLKAAGFRSVSIAGTFGYWGSLAWELNMLVAGSWLQAAVFPIALALASLDRAFPSRSYNGWLAVASV